MDKKKAFTLAEVLITLGVIGVVAAMTMPSLIANYKKKVWVNQLKKTVSTLEQGFRMVLAEDGADSLYYSSLCSSYTNGVCNINSEKLFKIFNATELNSESFDDMADAEFGGNATSILLADGSCVRIYDMNKTYFPVIIDINGSGKGPNQIARDVYYLQFRPNTGILETTLNAGPFYYFSQLSTVDSQMNNCKSLKRYDSSSFYMGSLEEECILYAILSVAGNNWEMKY